MMEKTINVVAWVVGFLGFLILLGAVGHEDGVALVDILRQAGISFALMLGAAWVLMREPKEGEQDVPSEIEEFWNAR